MSPLGFTEARILHRKEGTYKTQQQPTYEEEEKGAPVYLPENQTPGMGTKLPSFSLSWGKKSTIFPHVKGGEERIAVVLEALERSSRPCSGRGGGKRKTCREE